MQLLSKTLILLCVACSLVFANEELSEQKELESVRLQKSSVSTGVALQSDIAKVPASITVIDPHIFKKCQTLKLATLSMCSLACAWIIM